jgi:hypothetical protein
MATREDSKQAAFLPLCSSARQWRWVAGRQFVAGQGWDLGHLVHDAVKFREVRPLGSRFHVVAAPPSGKLGGKSQGNNLVYWNVFSFRRRARLSR